MPGVIRTRFATALYCRSLLLATGSALHPALGRKSYRNCSVCFCVWASACTVDCVFFDRCSSCAVACSAVGWSSCTVVPASIPDMPRLMRVGLCLGIYQGKRLCGLWGLSACTWITSAWAEAVAMSGVEPTLWCCCCCCKPHAGTSRYLQGCPCPKAGCAKPAARGATPAGLVSQSSIRALLPRSSHLVQKHAVV